MQFLTDKEKDKGGHTQIQLDSTREESLRSQYVPPEPKISILSRPKTTNARNLNGQKSKAQPVKTLEQVEKWIRLVFLIV